MFRMGFPLYIVRARHDWSVIAVFGSNGRLDKIPQSDIAAADTICHLDLPRANEWTETTPLSSIDDGQQKK
jgi:hypothetical protein